MLGASVSDCLPPSGEGPSLGTVRQGLFSWPAGRDISGRDAYARRGMGAAAFGARTLLLHDDAAPPAWRRSFIAFGPIHSRCVCRYHRSLIVDIVQRPVLPSSRPRVLRGAEITGCAATLPPRVARRPSQGRISPSRPPVSSLEDEGWAETYGGPDSPAVPPFLGARGLGRRAPRAVPREPNRLFLRLVTVRVLGSDRGGVLLGRVQGRVRNQIRREREWGSVCVCIRSGRVRGRRPCEGALGCPRRPTSNTTPPPPRPRSRPLASPPLWKWVMCVRVCGVLDVGAVGCSVSVHTHLSPTLPALAGSLGPCSLVWGCLRRGSQRRAALALGRRERKLCFFWAEMKTMTIARREAAVGGMVERARCSGCGRSAIS
ncbi:hypothetical protein C8Q78DRAFT_834033 [Trametes maxima]|nr:hypothetical protein C8Q78DRAFT_834033 [Trametes maxima]